MARRRKFTREELEDQLEMIDIYWHRHGDEEEAELKDYIRELYEALPESRREPIPAIADAQPVAVDLKELDQLLYSALNPTFDEQAVAEELGGFVAWLKARGGELADETITVERSALREVFDLRFNSTVLNDDLMERLQVVRKFLAI